MDAHNNTDTLKNEKSQKSPLETVATKNTK